MAGKLADKRNLHEHIFVTDCTYREVYFLNKGQINKFLPIVPKTMFMQIKSERIRDDNFAVRSAKTLNLKNYYLGSEWFGTAPSVKLLAFVDLVFAWVNLLLELLSYESHSK